MNFEKIMMEEFNIDKRCIEIGANVEKMLSSQFKNIDEVAEFNQYKVLKAMQKNRLTDAHFNWNTGYGYGDIGRDVVESIYSDIFHTEDALVRTQIVNGTHALTLSLYGVLRSGDEMLSITGKPYDTLEEVIGISGDSDQSLKAWGISYQQVNRLDNGSFDYDEIRKQINDKTKMVYIQRSVGYSWQSAVTIDSMEEIISFVKKIKPDVVVMVDNCYGEFIETKEPTDVGADIMAGSLIKNIGGGLALSGGYVVGKKYLITKVAERLTSIGIGKECGLTFGQTRTMLQGLFMAPHVVAAAIKSAIYTAGIFKQSGFKVSPDVDASRSDIIQAVELGSEKKVIAFCKAIQHAAPVDSFVSPEPWAMPGYTSNVIMAAGAFVQGSSIELSADAPIREPYIVYFQGGLTFSHGKLGALKALSAVIDID